MVTRRVLDEDPAAGHDDRKSSESCEAMKHGWHLVCGACFGAYLLVCAQGCGKTVQGTASSKTLSETKPPGPRTVAKVAVANEAATAPPSASAPSTALPPKPASAEAPAETLPGEERVADDLVVTQMEPPAALSAQNLTQEPTVPVTTGLQDVFFAFDSWTITEDGKRTLEADAEWLKANKHYSITIEGHCDERGTQAYNLVLGEKRAKAVRSFLIDLGVDPLRLTVISYGKVRPFCREHTEECYQQNRRAHLVVQGK